MTAFDFRTVGTLLTGPGSVQRLPELCRELGISRLFLVTDPGVARAGLPSGAVDACKSAGITVSTFADVQADPPESVIRTAVAQGRGFGADGVVGFGGGSAMDVAKLVAFLLGDTGQALGDIYGVGACRGSRLPLIQVPTTAGTGSEVTPISIVTTGEAEKKGVVSPQLLADAVLLDADLTLGLPPAVTAATGIDAMVHAIEAYTSRHKKNPLSDLLAREALRLLGGAIRRAVSDGRDRAARQDMLLGAMLAGQAFANAPVAAVHALAYPLGGHFHLPHGLTNALVLPHVIRFNSAEPAAAAAYAELSAILFPGRDGTGRFADDLASLSRDLGLPPTLREVGVGADSLDLLATDAMKQTRLLVNNPREVTLEDARRIYGEAL
ncbi:iron-containing alcohol dehydrogenase [Aerophototrophica crusticola]|uniref:Alcohol dehydrogenase 2 n=1 Tax=Aerophototrophica crusticola TaxID=1709002 RepID=A0A858R560_9PROT|nr:iron-containing alcohol dehydrogenase [Rhodospirillaceae bacterium B3]